MGITVEAVKATLEELKKLYPYDDKHTEMRLSENPLKKEQTIVEIKSVLSEKNEAVFPTVFSERTQNQLKNIQEMLDKGYNVAFIIVSLNPYVKKLTIDKSTEFYSELTRCIENGMEIRAYTSHLKDYEIEIKKQIPLLYS